MEGWHRAFALRVGHTHPTLRRLFDKIRKEQASTEVQLIQLQAGAQLPPPKKQYVALTQRLERLVERYQEYDDKLQFMSAVAINY